MGLGIIEPREQEDVPGTVFLSKVGSSGPQEHGSGPGSREPVEDLKQNDTIILVPQPSDSPIDPLNWPRWKKEMFMLTFAFAMGCIGGVGPLLSTAAVPLAREWDTSIQDFVRNYNSVYLGGVAIGSIVNVAFAVKYGKRPVLLANSLLLVIGNFWGGASQSLPSMAGSRFVAGWGVGCWQTVIPANISDVWFVHQRGFRVGIFNLGLMGGLNLVLPISAVIITNYGWRPVNYGMGGAFILAIILVLLFMPESSYQRSKSSQTPQNIQGSPLTHVKNPIYEHREGSELSHEAEYVTEDAAANPTTSPGSVSRRSQYMFWTGETYDSSNLFQIMLRPFQMAMSPAVAWSAVLYSSGIAWQVVLGVTVSQIFSAPPYEFSVIGVGLAKMSAFAASLLGAIIARPLSDGLAVRMAKLNNGIYEPEFRLPLVLSYLLFTATGFFTWGSSARRGDPWPIPVVVGLGGVALGVQLTCTAASAYVIDCHSKFPLETFAFLSFLKCVFATFLTLFVSNWIIAEGVDNVFFTLGGVTTAMALSAVPMYLFGKRMRIWYARRIAV